MKEFQNNFGLGPKSSETFVATYGGHSFMALYTSSSKENSQTTMNKDTRILYSKPDSWLYGKFQRKLVNESMGTFLSLQKSMENSDGDVTTTCVKKSREYRSVIQACVSEINDFIEHNKFHMDEESNEMKQNCELLYKMELILGLIEIIFIDAQPGSYIMEQLLHWIRLHFPQPKENTARCLETEQPSAHPQYWDACYGLIFQGLTWEACGLLNQHPECHTDPFLSMNELLRKMPVYHTYTGVAISEFRVRWLHWQEECESRLQKQEYSSVSQLEKICRILCGEEHIFLESLNLLDTWYHLMISRLYYTTPWVMIHRLSAAAQESLSMFSLDVGLGSLDQLLLHIIEKNYHQVLRNCYSVLDNLWFTAHLADLLYHSCKIIPDPKQLEDLRQSLLLDYALDLTSHCSLWQVGLQYLDFCSEAQHAIEMVLERIPLTSEAKALKVVGAAKARGLEGVVKSVCRIMGRSTMSKGQMGSAMWWSIRSQDSTFTSYLAHKMLHRYINEGKFDCTSLLDNLGPSMLLSDALTFLAKYREFHNLYQKEQFQEAGDLLVSLITSRMAPKYFWPVLLEDALPLLESDEPLITVQQTYDLLYCLHNVTFSDEVEKIRTKELDEKECSFAEKEAGIRLALSNNLARAIVFEGTNKDNY